MYAVGGRNARQGAFSDDPRRISVYSISHPLERVFRLLYGKVCKRVLCIVPILKSFTLFFFSGADNHYEVWESCRVYLLL